MTETRVTSDLADRPSESVTRDANGNLVHKSVLNYDGKNRVKEFVDILPEATHKTAYTYDADNRVTEVKYDDSDTHKVNLTYDLLNRVTNRTVTNGVPYSTNYTYVAGDTATYGAKATTSLIETITQGSGANAMNFAYTYDSRGNITSETRNGVTVSYEYDELGQLIRVNDPSDPVADSENGTTWVYTYDRGGNILRKDAYAYTMGSVSGNGVYYWVYTYDSGWKDQLKTVTKYDTTVTPATQTLVANFDYDAIGNPESDNTWTYTWEKGRQLKSMHNANTGVTMEFKYNQNGIRTQKIKKVNGAVEETTNYVLSGKKIVALTNDYDSLYFTYDASGTPATVIYNGATFTYVKNLQGDIVGILDANGDIVVKYQYDAWGKLLKTSGILRTVLGKANPFRYRGYAYDEETGLYYLRSRYYSSDMGRFINADVQISVYQQIGCGNIFCYCNNSPTTKIDNEGFETSDLVERNITVYVRCFIDPFKYGHSEIMFGDNKNKRNKTYTFGRYREVYEDTNGLTGEGVLVVTSNNKFSYGQSRNKGRTLYLIELAMTPEEHKRLCDYYNMHVKSAKEKDKEKYILPDDYHIKNNNCTTFLCNGLHEAYIQEDGSSLFPRKNIWIPNSLRLYCEFLYMSNSPIIKSITLVEDY